MRRSLFLPLMFALPALAVAAPPTWHVAVQTYSFHEHTTEVDLHNTTPGAGLIRRQDNWLLGAGIFRNSVGRWAGYGYGGYQFPLGPVRLGAIAGVDSTPGGREPQRSSSPWTAPLRAVEPSRRHAQRAHFQRHPGLQKPWRAPAHRARQHLAAA